MLDDHVSRGSVDLGQVVEQRVGLLQAFLRAQLVLEHVDDELDLAAQHRFVLGSLFVDLLVRLSRAAQLLLLLLLGLLALAAGRVQSAARAGRERIEEGSIWRRYSLG